jgi:transposase
MDELFDLPPAGPIAHTEEANGQPRLMRPDRSQLVLRPSDLDALLAPDHEARLVWAFAEGLDLAPFRTLIRSVAGHAGRPAIDPAILLALWLYATLEGIGSARALERLCDEHDAYRWICGGVSVNHHTLADFRVEHAERLEALLVESVAALLTTGEVALTTIAHDGVRVRASAGAGSFRGRRGLERALAAAQERVASLRAETADDPAATSRRVAAAKERAARETDERARKALALLPELEAVKARNRTKGGKTRQVSEARVSTTDPDARVMRMGDGGWRPAWNVQLTSDVATGLVCGVGVTNVGSDHGLLGPAVWRIRRAFARQPAAVLADGGFVALADIETLEGCGIAVHAPLPAPRDGTPAPLVRDDDSPGVAAWRARMGTDEAKLLYRSRGASIEWVNALARNRGLQLLRVRGEEKVRSVALWFALAHNLARTAALRRAAAT